MKESIEKEKKEKGKEKERDKKSSDKERDKKSSELRVEPATVPGGIAATAAAVHVTHLSLRDGLSASAGLFMRTHYSQGSCVSLETEGLVLMRKLCSSLPSAQASEISQLLDTLSGTDVSVFELLNSGAVRQLLSYLTAQDLREHRAVTSSTSSASENVDLDRAALQRLAMFVEAALPRGSGSSPALLALVRKLQAALSSLECFPVLAACFGTGSALGVGGGSGSGFPPSRMSSAHAGGGRGGYGSSTNAGSSLSNGLAMLTQPLKLRLSRHPKESNLKEYSSNIVMIEPLASMSAIEDFLLPRVSRLTGPSDEGIGELGTNTGGVASGSAPASGPKPKPDFASRSSKDEVKRTAAGAAGAGAFSSGSGPTLTGSAVATTSTRRPAGAKEDEAGGGGGGGGHLSSAKLHQGHNPFAPSKAQKIPLPLPLPLPDVNRRVTRSQARMKSESDPRLDAERDPAATGRGLGGWHPHQNNDGGDDKEEDMDIDMHDGVSKEHHNLNADGRDSYISPPEANESQPMFDHDDDHDDEDDDDGGSFEEELNGDGGAEDVDLDMQPSDVHDLHVDEPLEEEEAAAAAGGGVSVGGLLVSRGVGSVTTRATAGGIPLVDPHLFPARGKIASTMSMAQTLSRVENESGVGGPGPGPGSSASHHAPHSSTGATAAASGATEKSAGAGSGEALLHPTSTSLGQQQHHHHHRSCTAAAAVVRGSLEGPKLIFFLGDKRLSSNMTVFQAIQQMSIQQGALGHSSVGTAEAQGGLHHESSFGAALSGSQQTASGRRLWDEVHTLHYRRAAEVLSEEASAAAALAAVAAAEYTKEMEALAGQGSQACSTALGGLGGQDCLSCRWSSSPLHELLHLQALQELDAGEQCRDVLQLLQVGQGGGVENMRLCYCSDVRARE